MEATISAQDVITFAQDKDASGAKGAIANLIKQKNNQELLIQFKQLKKKQKRN